MTGMERYIVTSVDKSYVASVEISIGTRLDLHFHFHTFSGWGTSRGPKSVLKTVFFKCYIITVLKTIWSVLFGIKDVKK